jgi:uncharacterized protein YrrD
VTQVQKIVFCLRGDTILFFKSKINSWFHVSSGILHVSLDIVLSTFHCYIPSMNSEPKSRSGGLAHPFVFSRVPKHQRQSALGKAFR